MIVPNMYKLKPIDFVGGSTEGFVFNCFSDEKKKSPVDLKLCTANFSIISYVNKTGMPLISKTMQIRENERDMGYVHNILAVTLEPADTVNLCGKYIYQITIKDEKRDIEIPSQGICFIANNINKSFVRQA